MLADRCRPTLLTTEYDDSTGDFVNNHCVQFNTTSTSLFKTVSDGSCVNGNAGSSSSIPFDVAGAGGTSSNTTGTIGFWFKADIDINNLSSYNYAYIYYCSKNKEIIKIYFSFSRTSSGNYTLTLVSKGKNTSSETWYQQTPILPASHPNELKDYLSIWKHYTIVIKDTIVETYQNGVKKDSFMVLSNKTALSYDGVVNTTNAYDTVIGTYSVNGSIYSSQYKNHQIDEFCVFKNNIFTDAQVEELYNDGHPFNITTHSQASDLFCWYRMGDHSSDNFTAGTSNGCYDSAGNSTLRHLDVNANWNSGMNLTGDVPT